MHSSLMGRKPSVGAILAPRSFRRRSPLPRNGDSAVGDLITAFVAATEVILEDRQRHQALQRDRGFHAPGTTGPFGAAVGVGKLLGFDESKMTNVLGIAASLSCGLVQFSRSGTGGMVKRLHFGRANESGVLAANLADRGFTVLMTH